MIKSRHNETLKRIRSLRRSNGRGSQLLLEGPHLVAAAVEAGFVFETILATEEFVNRHGDLLSRLPTPPRLVERTLLNSVADSDSPRGLVAVVRRPPTPPSFEPRADGTYLYLAGLQDPGNLGALARVAEASGADGMALSPGTVHPFHPRALRASAGSLLRLPVCEGVSLEELRALLEAASPRTLALVPHGGQDLYSTALEGSWVVAVGAEGAGLGPQLEAQCDLAVTIPIAPAVESLNATVAAALALFEIRRSRQERGSSAASRTSETCC